MNESTGDHSMRRRRIRSALARGAGAAMAVNAVGAAMLYVSHLFLARWMGGEQEYGVFALAFTWSQILGFIAGFGLPVAALRFVPEYLERKDTPRLHGFICFGGVVSLFIGLVMAALGTVVALAWAPEALQPSMILGLWLSPIFAVVNVQKEAMRGARWIASSLISTQVLLPAGVTVGGLIVMIATGSLSAKGALAILGVVGLVVLAVQQVQLRMILPKRGGAAAMMTDWRFWLAVGLPLLLVQESLVILRQTDVVMIGFFKDTAEVGRYSAAARTAMLGRFGLLAMNAIAAPMIASFHTRNDRDGLQYMVRTATQWIFWPSVVMAVMICVFAGPVLALFGKGFVAGSSALIILVLGQLASASFGPVGHLLKLTGHHYKGLRVYGATVVVNIALNCALIPTVGIEGAAVATTATIVLRNVWSYALVRKHLGVHCFAFFHPARS